MSKRPTMTADLRSDLNKLRREVRNYGINAAARDARVTPAKLSRWTAGLSAHELRVDELERVAGVLGWVLDLYPLER